jgi:hypothetical protein
LLEALYGSSMQVADSKAVNTGTDRNLRVTLQYEAVSAEIKATEVALDTLPLTGEELREKQLELRMEAASKLEQAASISPPPERRRIHRLLQQPSFQLASQIRRRMELPSQDDDGEEGAVKKEDGFDRLPILDGWLAKSLASNMERTRYLQKRLERAHATILHQQQELRTARAVQAAEE